jgi:hypothetical protein
MSQKLQKAPLNLKLKTENRIYAKCAKCNFNGDTIYFNSPEGVDRSDNEYWSVPRICGFCELPASYKMYGETAQLRLKDLDLDLDLELEPGVRQILTAEEISENGYLKELQKLSLAGTHIFTVTKYSYGAALFEIYTIKLVDD